MEDNVKMRRVFEHSNLTMTENRDAEGILDIELRL